MVLYALSESIGSKISKKIPLVPLVLVHVSCTTTTTSNATTSNAIATITTSSPLAGTGNAATNGNVTGVNVHTLKLVQAMQ